MRFAVPSVSSQSAYSLVGISPISGGFQALAADNLPANYPRRLDLRWSGRMNATTAHTDYNESSGWTSGGLGLMPSNKRGSADIAGLGLSRDPLPSRDSKGYNERAFEVLAGSATFKEYQRAFEDATGLPLTLRAVEGWQLAHNGNRRQNGFCALMSRSSRSCGACLHLQQRVCDGVNGLPCTMSCTFGLSETAVGVKVGGDIIAYLQTGQVFFKPPTPPQTERALGQIREWGLKLDTDEAARLYRETPVVGRIEYQATVRLLQFFAEQLGATANQIVMQQQTSEPGQITRARQFMEEHHQEDLSLAAVARQAVMSTFYFCKMFKKVTGLNFTHYLSRLRVQKAKNLLLNRNCRISEIAYEVGFQSLTHFNRVFKRIAGESPTDYRRNMPAN